MKGILEFYLDFYKKYKNKYGEKIAVLMQVGSFYEIYSQTLTEDGEIIGNSQKISEILNIQCVKKKNPKDSFMCGFKVDYISKYIPLLHSNGYTVIIIDQDPKDPTIRTVSNVCSPGTNINETRKEANNIVSIYIESVKCFKSGRNINFIGLSSIDVTTGKSIIYESIDKINDTELAIDETKRFLLSLPPRELIINVNGNVNKDEILSKFGVNTTYFYNTSSKSHMTRYSKTEYQKTFFNKLFETKNENIMCDLGIENLKIGTLAYMCLITYVYEHSSTLLSKIHKPQVWDENEHLILDGTTISQLNLKELFEMINKCTTHMGSRLFYENIMNPITSCTQLNERYSRIETLKNLGITKIKDFRGVLKNICDIERYNHHLFTLRLHPYQFYTFCLSLNYIKKLLKMINVIDFFYVCDVNKKLNEYILALNKIFNLETISKYKLKEITSSIFQKGVYVCIDEIEERVSEIKLKMENEVKVLSNILLSSPKGGRGSEGSDTNLVKLVHTDRDGYYITSTISRGKKLKLKIEKCGDKGYNFSQRSSITVIKPHTFKNWNSELRDLKDKMITLSEKYYTNTLSKLNKEFKDDLIKLCNYVTNFDVSLSAAYVAILNNYCKPTLTPSCDGDNKIVCANLRHPIVEKVGSCNYIPNDVSITRDTFGYVIMSLNGSGKTVYMKSVGLAVIMAQAGFFVPASSLTLKPFKKIFTRILGNDNLFKGHSSYTVEMYELKSILTRADSNSIILADEICRGTEHISGVSIVAATILALAKRNVPFISTSHLHALTDIPEVISLTKSKKVKIVHMSVEINTNNYTYTRKLIEGPGPSIYGIEVARIILRESNNDFIESALKIRKRLLGIGNELVSHKVSKYNSRVCVDECEIGKSLSLSNESSHNSEKCEGQLDVHHILYQKDAKDNFVCSSSNGFLEREKGGSIYIHSKSNLVVLCKKHHNQVHSNNIIIHCWEDNINNRVLKWERVGSEKKKSKKKFNTNVCDEIRKIRKEYHHLSLSSLRSKLDIEKKIKISKQTLSKILNCVY